MFICFGRTENTLRTRDFEIRKTGVLRVPSLSPSNPKRVQFRSSRNLRVEELKNWQPLPSPVDAPHSEEFGLRFNQLNEFVRFGGGANGASASVAKCVRLDGSDAGIYALKVIFLSCIFSSMEHIV